jgi:hypothetical protein
MHLMMNTDKQLPMRLTGKTFVHERTFGCISISLINMSKSSIVDIPFVRNSMRKLHRVCVCVNNDVIVIGFITLVGILSTLVFDLKRFYSRINDALNMIKTKRRLIKSQIILNAIESMLDLIKHTHTHMCMQIHRETDQLNASSMISIEQYSMFTYYSELNLLF